MKLIEVRNMLLEIKKKKKQTPKTSDLLDEYHSRLSQRDNE